MMYENIIKLCKEKEVSIHKVETDCELGHGTIRYWKNPPLTVKNIQKVANFFGVTVDELLK